MFHNPCQNLIHGAFRPRILMIMIDHMLPHYPSSKGRAHGQYGVDIELSKDIKAELLSIPTLDVVIGGKRSPLMIAAAQTTASLYKCFSGELRKIAYPEMT